MTGYVKPLRCMRENCFANDNGWCTCLQAPIDKPPCPFFKTKEQYAEDLKKYPYINRRSTKSFDETV